MAKNLPVNAEDVRDTGSIPGLGRSLEEGMATHSSILAWRIPCMDRGAWWATVHTVVQSQARLKQLSPHTGSGQFGVLEAVVDASGSALKHLPQAHVRLQPQVVDSSPQPQTHLSLTSTLLK